MGSRDAHGDQGAPVPAALSAAGSCLPSPRTSHQTNPPPPPPPPPPLASSSLAACTPTPPPAAGTPATSDAPRPGGLCVQAGGPLWSAVVLRDASLGRPASASPSRRSPASSAAPPMVVAKLTPTQGFLTKRVPGSLALDPQALPHPFSTPGDAFLQFMLENFSSLVCSPVTPGSLLFAPSPVFIAVTHGDHQPTPASFVHSIASVLAWISVRMFFCY
jgi:hypothetical protein